MSAALPLAAADVYDAQRRLRGVSVSTPALSHPALDEIAGRSVICKVEALQRTGSFKFRGAYNAVVALSPGGRQRGVIGASSGNHAQALALAGRLLGVPVTVVVPHDIPQGKVDGALALGADIVTHHRQREDRDAIVERLAADRGFTVLPSANSQAVMAGAGTAALELLWQAPVLTAILVPVGGGGLAAGTAVAAKHINPNIKVIGVEPQAADDTAASLRAGQLAELAAVPDTIADGLRHTSPAPLPWEINRQLLHGVVTVTDTQIVQAMGWAFKYLKVVAEPSGAVALAALAGLDLPAGPVGVIISGGSVDLDAFHRLVATPPTAKEAALA
ncbi:threonine/serine dehydratase [Streptomyces sp. BE20]|uniref:threonine ammonia-lyase n=1 Tax=Streptomyces sp. BE20 TaxID=3002525 RepID=UPI002E78B4B0|nr:threonine/serine dehydratase [Streptomyces sp. BE20]MEE1829266.1 threonine/serine dehydratase [Streptomyces sp. BE20]